ncbi:hypothetical protein [Kordiimonas sp. SCSIO 12610]|uniref:hypothetical protein n=1 Tax=Kordiimonas sp. SCSIO 12610 TaxID=2829597 RepID=UPI002108CDF5|nr:hypothetical protein [Kordiimonas sp. SCSIO 12610]UTW56398.1 hypothetical protein KFF44_05705 [Kordiimonas sp. SCSIO 12610]
MTNLTRQLIETVEPAKQSKKLLQSLRFWSWGRLLERAGANACFVSENDFIGLMKREIKDLKIPYIERSDAFDEIKEKGFDCIIVLVKKDEARFVRELRKQFPDAKVYSTLYDIIPSKLWHPFELPADIKTDYTETPIADTFKKITLVVSSPGSDCEYFLKTLEDNGFGKAPHIFNKPFRHTIEYTEHFQIARFLKAVQTYHDQITNGGENSFIHLQTDVLNQILFRSRFTFKQFYNHILKAGINVIYFYRRDKIAQTAVQALMEDHHMRSIWHMPPHQKNIFSKNRKVNNETAWRTMLEIMDTEARVELFFRDNPTVKMVTLEEFRDAPENVLKGLAQFLETQMPKKITIPSYNTPYEEITNLPERITDFKRTMIDRLGLHVNETGSLVTENEAYLKRTNGS